MQLISYDIEPTPKPSGSPWQKKTKHSSARMSNSHQRYYMFRDTCRFAKMWFPLNGAAFVFRIKMPDSWSKAKKTDHYLCPHMQRPDLSNLLKGIEDAVYPDEDSEIWHYESLMKLWDVKGGIDIYLPEGVTMPAGFYRNFAA